MYMPIQSVTQNNQNSDVVNATMQDILFPTLLKNAKDEAVRANNTVCFTFREFTIMVSATSNLGDITRRYLNRAFCDQSPCVIGPDCGPITGKELENERATERARKHFLRSKFIARMYALRS